MIVGKHQRVFEYDGAFKCLTCKAKWGAFGGEYPLIAPFSCESPPCHCTHTRSRHIINGPCADCGCPAFQDKQVPLGCPECGHVDEPIIDDHVKAITEYNRAMGIYKEAMAAAWSKETNVPASEAEIVQQSMTQGGMRFYIRKRKEGEIITAAKNLYDKLSIIFYSCTGVNADEEMKALGEALKK